MPNSKTQSPREDKILTDQNAQDLAREQAEVGSHRGSVGRHLGATMVGERLAAHRFECLDPGYPGWVWEVTVTRIPRSKKVTVCEVERQPSESALLAPAWVPWEERLRPGDISRTDVLPYEANDPRLVSGFEQTDMELAENLLSSPMGNGRSRSLSQVGIDQAAQRWYNSERGPVRGSLKRAQCSTCGFLLKMCGSLRQVFGVCANEWSPDDGCVVSLNHSCGAHSETDTTKRRPQWPIVPPRLDEVGIDVEIFER